MSYTVTLENFEGPLDLLLYLVRKNEIDIQEIPIITITEQYIDYIDMMKAMNLDVAGEFLVMAATLMYLKSRALLPKNECDDETEEELQTLDDLKRQLLEYEQYKEAAQRLKEQNILERNVFVRSLFDDPVPAEGETLQEASIFDLISAFKNLIERIDEKQALMEVDIEHISVKDRINDVMQKLAECADAVLFEDLFDDQLDKLLLITTFLALLELLKMQAIKIYQNENFSSIYIYPIRDDDTHEESAGTGTTSVDRTENNDD